MLSSFAQPDNILLEENKAINQIKIIDFGLAANLVGAEELAEGSVVNGRIREKRGTLRFMAPEVFASDYGPKVDVSACAFEGFFLPRDKSSHHSNCIIYRFGHVA